MKTENLFPKSQLRSGSTVLINSHIFSVMLEKRFSGRLHLGKYLHHLLSDRSLSLKISRLQNQKLKKCYQSGGQDLLRVNIYPSDADWAHLSLLSHATGFSRCYIFIYLILIDLGIIKLDGRKQGTPDFSDDDMVYYCVISLCKSKLILKRKYRKQKGPAEASPQKKQVLT